MGGIIAFFPHLSPVCIGIEISVGGEIGETGGKNSTPEELKAFMRGYIRVVELSVRKGDSTRYKGQRYWSHPPLTFPLDKQGRHSCREGCPLFPWKTTNTLHK